MSSATTSVIEDMRTMVAQRLAREQDRNGQQRPCYPNPFRLHFAQFREARGLTIDDIARFWDLPVKHVRDVAAGRSLPRARDLHIWADGMCISEEVLAMRIATERVWREETGITTR